jgi:putative nucleotidyltransferase with HDIG domain
MGKQDLSSDVATLIDEAGRADAAGQREIARQRYETALSLLRGQDGAAASSIIRRIARSYLDEGQVESALDCLTAALAIAEARGADQDIAHAVNAIGNTHLMRGDFDTAEPMYARALALAVNVEDRQLEAMIAQNLGVIASVRGDLTAALDYYRSSLAIYRSQSLHRQIGHTLNNMGLVYTQMECYDDARAAYEEAVVHCRVAGDVPHRLLALNSSVSLLIAQGDIDRAAAIAGALLHEARDAGDQRALGETFKNLGVICRSRGDIDAAEGHLQAAFENALRREDLLLAAETATEQAELFEKMTKNRETLQALSMSHRLFTRLRAERNLADLQRRVARLEDRFYLVVARWARDIESKDAYTRGHCERVADYACALARDVGFDEMTMFWFRIGAVLHDVGKIAVPSEILNKPGRLTPEERVIMEQHAAAGGELLSSIDFPWDILPMVRSHHERWDGSGYPDRLAGEEIALSARIVCVADVFDALTTDRPYRRGFTRDEALIMMAAERGKTFDPDLLARFERLIRATRLYDLPAHMPAIAIAS